ncbi:MAG: Uma2 family endonuclease [Desulfamplus sp.]|nr:Uma2 family endonuclease [Desulfamplus sp.]
MGTIIDDKKLKERGCFGSPDIAVEILSKSTAYKDETEKIKIYEKHGVKEYWIINPDAEYIQDD